MNAEWWQVLLGGLIGSVLGGLATLVGVVLVIRHEQRLRSSDVIDEAMLTLLHAAHEFLQAERQIPDTLDERGLYLQSAFLDALLHSSVRSMRTEPRLHAATEGLQAKREYVDPFDERLTGAADQLATVWLGSPDAIRKGKVTFDSIWQSETEAFERQRALREMHRTKDDEPPV